VSRMVPMGVRAGMVFSDDLDPVQAHVMDKGDIAQVRRWHRNAALRAKKAGYDLVYVYGGHGLALIQSFLSRATNNRTDEYGGSLENRARLLRELIEDTKDAVGDTCAVPVRLAVEEAQYVAGLSRAEMEDLIGMLGELPDLWDFCMGSWSRDSSTARFAEEGFQEPFVRGLKRLTTKPVVGVGRFTSPDAMVTQIRSGVLDFIGAARPSIADPFLPNKIEAGRYDDIRECIGCNICVSSDMLSVPIRCTQNPTMGEEWRRGWHPERIEPRVADERVLVVGAGPAGLEAALALGRRGYDVALAEAGERLGGRVLAESTLPGLRSWSRVADYRIGQLGKLANVTVYPASPMTADDVLAFGAQHVAIATGSVWRRDGAGRTHIDGLPIAPGSIVLSPDDVMRGDALPAGPIIVYDDENYVMAGALAEKLALAGHAVTLVTPAALISEWTIQTLEQARIERRLVEAGVTIATRVSAVAIEPGRFLATDDVTRRARGFDCAAAVLVTMRDPVDDLARDLKARQAEWGDAGLLSVTTIGDALAPAMIVHAVHAGHLYAQTLGTHVDRDAVPFRRDPPR
jgi:dimethylamine/trimethylamine dehydrogenase